MSFLLSDRHWRHSFFFSRISSPVGFYIKFERNSGAVGSRDSWHLSRGKLTPEGREFERVTRTRRQDVLLSSRHIASRRKRRAMGWKEWKDEFHQRRLLIRKFSLFLPLPPFSSATELSVFVRLLKSVWLWIRLQFLYIYIYFIFVLSSAIKNDYV